MGLFGKDKPTKEKVREWQSKVKKEGRVLERQIQGIKREQDKTKAAIKASAKKNDMDSVKILAKEIVHSNKAINKIYAAKAHLTTIENGMTVQLATIRTAGCLQKSTEVMQSMQKILNLPEIQTTMRELSKEMMKAGIIDEMIEDAMDDMEPEEMEEDIQKEVDQVLGELIGGTLATAPSAVHDSLPERDVPEDEEEDMEDMHARLQALRS